MLLGYIYRREGLKRKCELRIMDNRKLIRNALTQMTGAVTDSAMTDIVSAYNLPLGLTLKIAQAVIKGTMQGVMQNCYDDVTSRQLSNREVEKHIMVFDVAERTFIEQAVKDGVDQMVIVMDDSQLKYAFEVAEHVSLEAIRQSEEKKIEILGRYYGRRFYQGPGDWQDMHQIIMMAGSLTYRQIVLIRLINEGFCDVSQEKFITNPSACVEINRMKDFGLWMTDMAMFKNDSSAGIQIKMLKPTRYTGMVCDALMLEKLSEEDIKRTLESLAISDEGEPAAGITQEDYRNNTEWEYIDEEEGVIIPNGKKSLKMVTTSPEDLDHLLKGNNIIGEADKQSDGSYMMKAIDRIIDAFAEFRKCKSELLYKSNVDEALIKLIGYFEECIKYGGLRILKGKRQCYEDALSGLKSDHLNRCLGYLRKAEEKEEGYDEELHKKEMDKWFEV